jgi:hypothetical protein
VYKKQKLKYYCERFSNNSQPVFTNQKVIIVYLFSIFEKQKFKINQIKNTSKARSANGLIVHIFGKLIVCFLKPIINP